MYNEPDFKIIELFDEDVILTSLDNEKEYVIKDGEFEFQ